MASEPNVTSAAADGSIGPGDPAAADGAIGPDHPAAADGAIGPGDVLVVRRGPGANCSSIGSVLDVLFLSGVVGGAILVAIAAALDDKRAPRGSDAEAAPGSSASSSEGDRKEGSNAHEG